MEKRPKKLLDQVREATRRKHYSIRTEKAYVTWVKASIPCLLTGLLKVGCTEGRGGSVEPCSRRGLESPSVEAVLLCSQRSLSPRGKLRQERIKAYPKRQ